MPRSGSSRSSARGRRVARGFLGVVLAGVIVAGIGVVTALRRSLPRLNGEVAVEGLQAGVRIERDALGVPTLTAASRLDASFALGWLHAQDRFFQMDLLRRSAAGELSALVGPAARALDRSVRVHRFRARAQRVAAAMPRAEHLAAYARGVNAGLASLGARPCEYWLLRTRPEPWLPEDIVLCVFAMYLDLQSADGDFESALGVVHDVLPSALAAFVAANGTTWDAPLVGPAFETPAIPGPDVVDLRRATRMGASIDADSGEEVEAHGSNNWAMSGAHTADGGALLAGDMHLGLAVPNIWYRASIVYPAGNGTRRVTGITLPGAPAIIAGSNGDVAWAFTNSEVDVSDLVLLEFEDAERTRVSTPDGPRRLDRHAEIIAVHGAPDDTLIVVESIWGPVIDTDHRGRTRVLRWIAHDLAAVDLGLLEMEEAASVDEAVEIANRTRIPTQNCVIVDRAGRIAWTLMGPLPRRFGAAGRLPCSWADGTNGWDGVRDANEVPRIVDPPSGRIWTANNRSVDGEWLGRIGDGGYALGARAQQIRDALGVLERATPNDFLQLQLDDRALFLAPWQQLMRETLELAPEGRFDAEFRRQVKAWGGRAAVESVGYRAVREFRSAVVAEAIGPLLGPCRAADTRVQDWQLRQREGAVWRLLQERPLHLLDARFDSWDDLLAAALDSTVVRLRRWGPALTQRTWGELNTTRIRHPLSRAIPVAGRWLDMPRTALPGDRDMPRVQSPTAGASQRMVVSPGREDRGFFHMPGGQSGHPWSRFYRNGHADWEEGRPTPFLPGPVQHTLHLEPKS